MTVPSPMGPSPIPTTVQNPEQWGDISGQVAAATGAPPPVALDVVAAFVGSVVPLTFEAESSGNAGLLRGAFTESVIAQVQRTAGSMRGQRPVSATIRLVGVPVHADGASLRVHVSVTAQQADQATTVTGMYWDLRFGAPAQVGQNACPNCGAPLAPGQLVCDHCGTDVRTQVTVPLLVSRSEMY